MGIASALLLFGGVAFCFGLGVGLGLRLGERFAR
jgi:hypothetical protein